MPDINVFPHIDTLSDSVLFLGYDPTNGLTGNFTVGELKAYLGTTGGEEPPPDEEPPVGVPSALGVAYVASQSSTAFNAPFSTYEILTDGNRETGACVYQSSDSWLKATFSQVVKVSAVTVGGGNVNPGFGTMQQHVNDCKLQYSTDDVNWTDVLTISGVTDNGPDMFKKFVLSAPIDAKYWRLWKANWVGTTEFKFE